MGVALGDTGHGGLGGVGGMAGLGVLEGFPNPNNSLVQ